MSDTIRNVNAGSDTVPIDSVEPHPENVNQGDIGGIFTSIQENGWFGRILVQKSSGLIVAGKHRWLAAKEAGAENVDIEWIDVDDDEARRIMLADNRLARLGMNDEYELSQLLTDLAHTDRGLAGTGYDGDDLDHLLEMLEAPDMDDVSDGEYDDADFWPTVRVQVPPDIFERWKEYAELVGDDVVAFTDALNAVTATDG